MNHFETAVRHVRYLRAAGEPVEEQERIAKVYQHNVGADWKRVMAEAQKPGPAEHPGGDRG